jgi:hypothetical protein
MKHWFVLAGAIVMSCQSPSAPSRPDPVAQHSAAIESPRDRTLLEEVKLLEGVYSMCIEVARHSGETIELKSGKFRYWFYSDVRRSNEPEYPLEGNYRIKGSTLILDHERIHDKKRLIARVNGIPVLWRDDGLEVWVKSGEFHPYAILLYVGKDANPPFEQRPSIEILEKTGKK